MSALSDAKKLAKYTNDLEKKNVALQYDYNRSLAQEDRSWQERMSNSAHQREIADLKAAGLNPVLSVTGGNGAVTTGGSSTSVSKPTIDMSLPKAVMDMAIAQLNSATALKTQAMNNATQLQKTAMENTSAYQIAQGTWQNNQDVKALPSGDSVLGQTKAVSAVATGLLKDPNKIQKYFESKFPSLKKGKETYNNYMTGYALRYQELKLKDSTKGLTRAERRDMKKYRRILKRNGVAKKYWK